MGLFPVFGEGRHCAVSSEFEWVGGANLCPRPTAIELVDMR